MAHAPILSKLSRSRAHRTFWSIVPFDMIADAVNPIDTPIAVTMPGHTRHNSMMGINVIDGSRAAPSAGTAGFADSPFGSSPTCAARSRSIARSNPSRAI